MRNLQLFTTMSDPSPSELPPPIARGQEGVLGQMLLNACSSLEEAALQSGSGPSGTEHAVKITQNMPEQGGCM